MEQIRIWSLYAVFCFLKFASDTFLQGKEKLQNSSFDYPEDQAVFAKGKAPKPHSDGLKRATALYRNDLENLVPFGFLSLAGALMKVSLTPYLIVVGVFCLSRILHAIFMVVAKQPHRNLSYQLGNLCQIAMIVLIARAWFE